MQFTNLYATNANAPYTVFDVNSMSSTPLRFTSTTPVHGITLQGLTSDYNADGFYLLKNDDTQEVYQFLFPERITCSEIATNINVEIATYYSDTLWSYSLTNDPRTGCSTALTSKVNLDNNGHTEWSLAQWWTWVQQGQGPPSISQAVFGALNAEVDLNSATLLPSVGPWPAGRYSFWAYDYAPGGTTNIDNVFLRVEFNPGVSNGVVAVLIIVIAFIIFSVLSYAFV